MAMSTPGSVRVASWHAMAFRRFWVSNILASFVQPLLYLLGLGVAVGALVDRTPTSSEVLDGASYVAYIAPGLMVTTAMAVASAESLWPIMNNFVWSKGYLGVAATPLGTADIVGGHALWMTIRSAVTSAAVACVLALFPAARSWGLIPAIGAAALTGLGFAMPLMAFATTRKIDNGFAAMQRFVIVPLFLFGGAFYPITQLPGWTQAIIKLLPLWHGIELARGFTLGGAALSTSLQHVAAIGVWIIAGTILSYHYVRRRLYV